MNSLFQRIFSILLIFICFLGACTADDLVIRDGKYSFYVLGKDGKEYILESNQLDSGILEPEKNGFLLNAKDMDRDVLVKNGFFYHLNRKNELFSKFELSGNGLRSTHEIKLQGFALENFNWISKDTLLIVGLNTTSYNQVKYFLIETNQMKIIKAGDLSVPKPVGKFKSISVGFIKKRKESIFVGYTYNFPISKADYSTSDTMYVSKLKYPEMEFLDTDKDIRSTYPGGENTVQSYSFTTENGDFYFMSCPGVALGNRPDLSTGIFRIKEKSNSVDKEYFFNISDSKIANHAYGIWYIGNQKAIIRSERKDLFTGLSDHYSVPQFEFYILDLDKQSVKKLSLPLDKGTRRECVFLEGSKAYIAINSNTGGNFIWEYDINKQSLKKGLQISGDTDFILRMDKLKN